MVARVDWLLIAAGYEAVANGIDCMEACIFGAIYDIDPGLTLTEGSRSVIVAQAKAACAADEAANCCRALADFAGED